MGEMARLSRRPAPRHWASGGRSLLPGYFQQHAAVDIRDDQEERTAKAPRTARVGRVRPTARTSS